MVTLNKYLEEIEKADLEAKENFKFNRYLRHFERRICRQLGLWYSFPDSPNVERSSLAFLGVQEETSEIIVSGNDVMQSGDVSTSVNPADVVALAKKARRASKKAESLAVKSSNLAIDLDESVTLSCEPDAQTQAGNFETYTRGKVYVRSKRLLERQYKKRRIVKMPKHNLDNHIPNRLTATLKNKIERSLDLNDPLRLFLWGPVTKQLLTAKEEKDLFVHIQESMLLEDVKLRLQSQSGHEPTVSEWAQAVGLSCELLQSRLSSGKRSREKLIYANFRLVIHLARHYEGKGLSMQDLLQEGSKGLMKSVEKFKPKVGCRFPSYAYWWIRQFIRKAIFLNSRTIRLPENVFALLKKIKSIRKSYVQEGHLTTNEDIASCIGMDAMKLERLLINSRNPLSIENHPWSDCASTFQEFIADPEVEIPDLAVTKQMMKGHVHNILKILDTRERKIIEYRFGFYDNKKTLTEIGMMYGLSKERIRQLESRALDKLKASLHGHDLGAYLNMIT